MKPVLILQHEAAQGPGYLLDCPQRAAIPTLLLRPDQGDSLPRHSAGLSGLVLLGCEHSVHDDLPWIRQERSLLHDALERHRPVLGHCFGAQQLARRLGAEVRRQPRPDIGWRELWITPQARTWACKVIWKSPRTACVTGVGRAGWNCCASAVPAFRARATSWTSCPSAWSDCVRPPGRCMRTGWRN
jgi:GMP synthase-like glutamine amidotransferase